MDSGSGTHSQRSKSENNETIHLGLGERQRLFHDYNKKERIGHKNDTESFPKQNVQCTFVAWDCPLCMEPIDNSDIGFTPCECGYQICRFCWHHIKTSLNDKCPACRRSYSEQEMEGILERKDIILRPRAEITDFENLTTPKPNRISQSPILQKYQHLVDRRIIQRNLVYVIGIPYSESEPQFVSLEERLADAECFGKYGNVTRVVLNAKRKYRPFGSMDSQIKTVSAFVTFSTAKEASRAIEGIDNSIFNGVTLHATHGTTKYCAFFLRGQSCPNISQCLFLHSIDDSPIPAKGLFIEQNVSPIISGDKSGSEMNDIVMFLKSALPNAHIHT